MSLDGTPLKHQTRGDTIGAVALSEGGRHPHTKRAVEHSVFYVIPRAMFEDLRDTHPPFANHFVSVGDDQARGTLLREMETSARLKISASPLGTLVQRNALLLDEKTSIRKAAKAMDRERLDCLLLEKNGTLVGIVTDHDLCSRVIAKGRSIDDPVATVMTPNPVTLDAGDLGIDAILQMTRLGIEHIPVLENNRAIGVITAKNLSQNATASAIHLVRETYRRRTLEELQEIAAKIPALLVDLTRSWIPAHNIGCLIASVTDALNIRLLQLAEAELGAPPVAYNWVVVGSLGRCEQTAISAQDSFLLLDNDFNETKHGDYFTQLAQRVCGDMDRLGYGYCPGGIMAQTPQWRQPLKTWRRTFRRWIEEPDPKALMFSNIFFDQRVLYGKEKLFQKLKKYISERGRENRIYLAHMAANALTSHPPLGLFGNLVLERGGIHDRTLDLKRTGVTPIVDLARIYALSVGGDPINTVDRLKLAAGKNLISREGSQDLLDAFELISITRLRYQARLIEENKKVVNHMPPKLLSNMERDHLKDAFAVTRTMQAALRQHFQADSIGW